MANTGPNGNLGHDQVGDLNRRLQALPGFRDALEGRVNSGQFPTGADGLVAPNFREANARYFAQLHGVDLGSGSHIDSNGNVHAVNDQAWYTDPRWLGPLTVGGLSAGAGLAGGGGAGASSAATTGSGGGAAAGGGSGFIGADVGHTAAASLAAGGGGAASTPLWAQIAKIAAPVAGTLAMNRNNGGSNQTALNPQQQALMNQILQMGVDRMQSTIPVHDAAMRLAQSMAPTGAPNPRMDQAIAQAQTPHPQTQMSPQALEAMQRLMAQVPR